MVLQQVEKSEKAQKNLGKFMAEKGIRNQRDAVNKILEDLYEEEENKGGKEL